MGWLLWTGVEWKDAGRTGIGILFRKSTGDEEGLSPVLRSRCNTWSFA